ncbi:uncharacterized protein LOC135382971 [Ornithodoros turicata]|uniref:uncharacterized protein LOC135382971 n=1 Tax=Ornithodoros turicata TaxID=34597 RepID=UPI0031390DDA
MQLCDDSETITDNREYEDAQIPAKLSMVTLVEASRSLEELHACESSFATVRAAEARGMHLKSDKAVQTSNTVDVIKMDHPYSKTGVKMATVETQTVMCSVPASHGLTEEDNRFYTGISLEAFTNLVAVVSSLSHPPCCMSIADQVLLTLMRLRLGLLYGDLARRLKVSTSQSGKIFRYMTGVLADVLGKVIVWLPKQTIRANMPAQFIEGGYEGTTCIIDCSEVQMQRPRVLYSSGQTYSHYKSSNTVKFLIAVAPDGFIMFISGAYGGRASDKFIVEDSHFCAYLSPYDEIMADRGFGLTEDMKVKRVKLNVPAFWSRRISTLRIHVERAINRIKTYRIFKQPLPIHHKKLMNNILLACAGLCNLKRPLIAEQHVPVDEEDEECDDEPVDECYAEIVGQY